MRKYQLLIIAAVIVLDRLTKWLVTRNIPLDGEVPLIPGLFRLTHLENTGAAFSMLAGASGWQRWFFVGLAVVVSGLIVVWLWRLPAESSRWVAARRSPSSSLAPS